MMKHFEVVYKNGRLIDIESGQRIILVDDAKYKIEGSDSAFLILNELLRTEKVMNSEEKEKWVMKAYGENKYKNILPAGTKLFFRVGISKQKVKQKYGEYGFTCTLLEDLYIYLKRNRENDSETDWGLAGCQCILDKCLTGGLTLSEKLQSNSLNSLFSNTVQFYFPMQRSGSTNVFENFFLVAEKYSKTSHSLEVIWPNFSGALSDLRRSALKEINSNFQGDTKLKGLFE